MESGQPHQIAPLSRRISFSTIAFAACTLFVFVFLAMNHGRVPMWVEGIGELQGQILAMLGNNPAPIPCSLRVGHTDIPLGLTAYIGPGYTFAYLPAAAFWVKGWSRDPYSYRYAGVVLFILAAWLLFVVCRRAYGKHAALLCGLIFLTTPTLLFGTMTEYQMVSLPLALTLLAIYFFQNYLHTRRPLALIAGSFFISSTALTRLDTLVWFVPPAALYFVLCCRTIVPPAIRQLRRTPWVVVAAIFAAAAPLMPMVLFNIWCPQQSFGRFFRDRISQPQLDVPPYSQMLNTRLLQFWDHNILTTWTRYEVNAPNFLFGGAVIVAAGVLIAAALRKKCAAFPLLVVAVVLPFSVLGSKGARPEHMTILQPALIALLASAGVVVSSAWRQWWAGVALLSIALVGNLWVSSSDWITWRNQPRTSETMLNHSAPVLLTEYLLAHHPKDRILYTNIGLNAYVQYMSRGRLVAENISNPQSDEAFAAAVRTVVETDRESRKVFVCTSREHEGDIWGTFRRTTLLYRTLDALKVPFKVTVLSSRRNEGIYEIVVVDPVDATGT